MPDDLREIKLFDSPHNALLARDALEANGIHAVLSSNRLGRIGWSWDGPLIRLSVSQQDVEAAKAFFAEADAIARLHARERCPRCGSAYVTRVTTRRLALLAWIRRRDPLFRTRSGWRCGNCGRFSEAVIR